MSPRRSRLVVYAVVALLAGGAVTVMRPLPERPAASVVVRRNPTPAVTARLDSLGRGETLSQLFGRSRLGPEEARQALLATSAIDARRLPVGMKVVFTGSVADSLPSQIVFHLAVDRLLRLTRTAGRWAGKEELLPWTTDTIVVHGEIRSTLYDAFDVAASELPAPARAELAWDVADIFEYRLDMSRDLQPGDAFDVLVERQQGAQGAVRTARVLAAEYSSGASHVEAIRHEGSDGKGRYYDQQGKSLQAAFLRAPLSFRRISSVFGRRKHPILGTWRAHKGTDYAASSGTPVRSVGNGVVVFAGKSRGYGNTIDVRHPNGFVTRYGHLRGFARGIRRGSRVGIAETIGYVGMTGLATGPHLHFEVLVGGIQRNPRDALASKSGEPLPERERVTFDRARATYLALIEQAPSRVTASNE